MLKFNFGVRFMDKVYTFSKTPQFKGFVCGFFACVLLIFTVAAATSKAITFTASNAIVFTQVPSCHCPNVQPCPEPVPAPLPLPKKKKGDIGEVSMLDCVSGCKCSGNKTEGCTCFVLTSEKCTCQTCSCDGARN